jgi:chemotaxis protein MotB
MAGKRDRKANGATIVIRREEVVEGGHHGGAWKVAYADFVTAMMAFFLLMWLLNATTEDQRKGLADYFSPNNLMSHASSGTGEPFGGHTAYDEGNLVSDRGTVQITEGKRPPLDEVEEGDAQVFTRLRKPGSDNVTDPTDTKPDPALTDPTQTGSAASGASPALKVARDLTAAEIDAEKDRLEKASFEKAAEEIREAVRADPALAEVAKQLSIDMTPDGLRIQIMDEIKRPMFASGSAVPNDRARELVRMVVPILQKLTQAISIAGHTDAAPYAGAGRTNWELSSERANATRRLLTDAGLADTRIRTVTGHADRDPLLPGDPFAAANRRIAILVLREVHTAPTANATPAIDPAQAPDPAKATPRADPAQAAPRADPVKAASPADPAR